MPDSKKAEDRTSEKPRYIFIDPQPEKPSPYVRALFRQSRASEKETAGKKYAANLEFTRQAPTWLKVTGPMIGGFFLFLLLLGAGSGFFSLIFSEMIYIYILVGLIFVFLFITKK